MSEVNSVHKKNVGRRPLGSNTKGAILKAAGGLFAAQGYNQTSLRHIAAVAGVDPALILHYFGSKKKLFVTSITPMMEGPKILPKVLKGDIETAGERLATAFVSIISDSKMREMMHGVFRSASSDAVAADVLRQFVEDAIMKGIEEYLPGPDKRLQANILGGQMIGLFIARYIIKLDPIASIDDDQLMKYLAPRLQAHFLP